MIVVGVAGAFLAGFALPKLGVSIGGGIAGAVLSATVGAVVLLVAWRAVARR